MIKTLAYSRAMERIKGFDRVITLLLCWRMIKNDNEDNRVNVLSFIDAYDITI